MLNFSTSFFQRKEKEEEIQIPKANVLAVWGSPSVGKTTVSVKLAHYLASRRKNVVLLLCDMVSPPLPCICSSAELVEEHSLGSILGAAHATPELIKENFIFHKNYKYLALIGMKKGENVFSYPRYTKVQAAELVRNLRRMTDYVIIDCGSNIAFDVLSAVSLIESDSVLRLATCSLKSISYLSSQLPLLRAQKWDADKQIRIVSDATADEKTGYAEQVFGDISYTIPHCKEIAAQILEGCLFQELTQEDSKEYKAVMELMGKELFGI